MQDCTKCLPGPITFFRGAGSATHSFPIHSTNHCRVPLCVGSAPKQNNAPGPCVSDILVGTDRQRIINMISKSNRLEGNAWYENRNKTGKEGLQEPLCPPRVSLVSYRAASNVRPQVPLPLGLIHAEWLRPFQGVVLSWCMCVYTHARTWV